MTKDKIFNWRFCLCCGIFVWFIINLLQGIFTEIHEDEAYYALYGEHLAWGYFDHPPMVGLMTFLSSLLFSGTLGVRICSIIASSLSLFVVWKMLGERQPNREKVLVFLILAFSIVMFNVYGFVATPDVFLILFSALFLLFYQHYLSRASWKYALLMGVSMALMVYSKYHAFLLLGLVVLSNLSLLKDGKFYVACLTALVLLVPHILWQVHADFPSFRYHLMQRSEPFRWSYFLEYLPNQLLVFNPFIFGAIVYALVKHRRPQLAFLKRAKSEMKRSAQDVFERGLWFIFVGFFLFFWLMAFRGHVEPHWTVLCIIPIIVLLYRNILVDNKLKKYFKRVIVPSLLLIVAMRIALLTALSTSFGFYGKEKRYQAIASVAGHRPVVFQGSFQKPALYHFFTGNESSSLRCFYDRMTQYDLWQFDNSWIGTPVFVYGASGKLAQQYNIGNEEFTGFLTDCFMTANRLVVQFEITHNNDTKPLVFHNNDTLFMDFSIYNPCPQTIVVQNEMVLKLLLIDENEVRYCIHKPIPDLLPNTTYSNRLAVVLNNMTTGKHHVVLCIGDRIANFAAMENEVEIKIVEP